MRQKLCVGLGIAMIAFVGIMVSDVARINDSSLTAVSDGEAKLVLGGGHKGKQYVAANGVTCNSGLSQCTGSGPRLHGDEVARGYGQFSSTVSCGGQNCSRHSYNSNKAEEVPE